MEFANVLILKLCFVFASCSKISPGDLKQQQQAMAVQDMLMMKEGIRDNANGIRAVNGGIQNIKEQFKSMSGLIHKTISTVKNANDSMTKPKDGTTADMSQVKCKLIDDLKLNVEKLSSCAENDQNGATSEKPSTKYKDTLMKVESDLTEVLKNQSNITEQLSALPQSDFDKKVKAGCFTLVNKNKPDGNDDNDNKCFNISAVKHNRVSVHCDNRNSRIADAVVSEISVTGRIEVRYNNVWGTVCYVTFSHEDGNVACRSAGFAYGVRAHMTLPGSGQIWLSNLYCNGTESDLFDCERDFPIGEIRCNSHSQDAIVTCFWLP